MRKNSLRNLLMSGLVALAVMATAGTYAQSTLSFAGETITGVTQPLSDTYFYTGCYSPVNIRIDTAGLSGRSADVKFFLSGFFDIQSNVIDYSGFYIGNAFDTYHVFGNASGDEHLTGGTAATGDYVGDEYWYINAYNDAATELNSGDADFATIYLKPIVTTSGNLNFYYLGQNINLDDSNVSSGINAEGQTGYTQYTDMIAATAGTGDYLFNAGYECPFKPYIASATYASILGSDLAEAYIVGVDDTYISTLGTTTPSTVSSPSSDYSGTIIHRAGPDLTANTMTTWDIWTNQPITVTLTGNDGEDMFVNMSEGIMQAANITLDTAPGGTETWSNVKELTITGQYESGFFFNNRISNEGATYAEGADYYTNFVEINTFFYDTYTTVVTTASILTGDGFEYIALSGVGSAGASDADNGRHADWTINDDEFRIIGFSGVNTLNFGQATTISYNDDLNALYVTGGTQDFSLIKTGTNGTDPENVIATDTDAIMFTETWAGLVYISDIAGNVTGVYVEVDVSPRVTFEIRGTPAFRDETNGANGDLTLTGEIRLGTYTGGAWTLIHDSRNVPSDDTVTLNALGTGAVSMVVPSSGDTFLAVFKGTGMLSIGFTGIWKNDISDTTTNYIDFTSGLQNQIINSGTTELFPNITYNAKEYIIAGDISIALAGEYDYINTLDLGLINDSLTVTITPSINYYDFDINSTINAIEQAIVLNYNDVNGWIYENDGVGGPAKATFDPAAI